MTITTFTKQFGIEIRNIFKIILMSSIQTLMFNSAGSLSYHFLCITETHAHIEKKTTREWK